MKFDKRTAELQTRLNELGYGPLNVDGQYGKNTEEAYNAYLSEIDPGTPNYAPSAQEKWWMSKAFIGAGATILVSIVGIFGYEMDSEQLSQTIVSLLTLSTGIMAFVGTIKRKAPIDTTYINPFNQPKRLRPLPSDNDIPSGNAEDPRGLFRDN